MVFQKSINEEERGEKAESWRYWRVRAEDDGDDKLEHFQL